ncbi:MAG: filamentous hemagglutinin N-terminal domain-containing protein, partial [Verrucomicrobiota bacterium]
MLGFQLGPSASLVFANPSGEQVIAGGATFDRAGSTLTITQGSDRVIINWQDFSIGAGEITNFIQPSATSAALNRVISQNVSEIYGTLNANGQIYLINPNGLVIGAGGIINAQSFIASTHDVSNAEFLAGGDLTFRSQNAKSKIQNLGAISADGGDIILIAQEVENTGTLSAPGGTVALAAGTEVLVKASGEERVFIQAAADHSKFEIRNSGLIQAATAELKAAGGNEYALAINNSGVIRATGVEKSGGRVFLRADGGRIQHSGTITASRKSENQNPKSETKFGGDIQILGEEIELADGSLTDASGTEGGGIVHIGGGFQGAELGEAPNAQNVTVAAGAQINADGGNGLVVLWSDGTTVFGGDITADGQGFVEVSGKERLSFTGTVDTQGGTLLLDPNNVEIGSVMTLAGASLISVGALTTALATNHVIINTSGTDGEDGDIRVSEAVLYNSTFDLTFLAHRNIEFNASVQNGGFALGGAAGDTGAINVVAGWDETLFPLPGSASATAQLNTDTNTFDFAALVAADAFGNNNGSVFIGDGTQTIAIAVGSRFGATNVATYDLNAQGGAVADSFAQLGFNANDGDGATSIDTDGAITVAARNDLSFSGGGGFDSSVQLGHGGRDASGNHSGAITITSVNDLSFSGGGFFAYGQLGHGGIGAMGNHSGAITITNANDLSFSAGGQLAYVQLGHGGRGATGSHSGAITITSAHDLNFRGGGQFAASVQLGHGGDVAIGSHSGAITITSVNDLSFSAGGGGAASAQLGHGGRGVDGDHSGAIQVSADGMITLTGVDADQYAWIGHGDDRGDGDAGNTVSGDVIVVGRGGITLTEAAIGHQIDVDGTYTSGDTLVGTEGNLIADAGSRFDSAPTGELRIYVSDAASDQVDGATLLNGVMHGAVTLPNNQGSFAFGSGPYVPNTSATGGATVNGNFAYYALEGIFFNFEVDTVAEAIAITDALVLGDVTLAFDMGGGAFGAVLDLDGGTQFITIDEALIFDSPHDLSFITTGDISFNASVQNGGFAVGGAAGDTGAMNIVAGFDGSQPSSNFDFSDFTNVITNTALFGNNMGSVFIGDGTQTVGIAVGSRFGATNVAAYDLTAQAGAAADSFVQLGFSADDGIFASSVDTDGAITVAALNDLTFSGGGEFSAYAQLGHGGVVADGNHSGAIMITGANDLTF